MSKQVLKPMSWLVKRFDCNSQQIVDYNVLKYFEKDIKHFKKISDGSKVAFAEALRREMSWRYWSKSEHELIIELDTDQHVLLKPWSGCREPEKVQINVTDDISFDWRGFAEYHIGQQIFKYGAKIDIYDQLRFRWDAFVDYCWTYRHKWQRNKNIN